MSDNQLLDLATPPACIADFCLIPLGTPTASVSKEVSQVQRLLKKSGLVYHMHSAGTTVGKSQCFYSQDMHKVSNLTLHHIEGPWDDVMRVIGQAHSLLHENGVVRIQSDIRVGSRTDKKQTAEDKVAAVKAILDKDEQA
ncbi:unnamed protein product [Aureobasidium mustum]|uniref:Thiamine-binding protein domain-containing protein n=1 Tax=Aureobasidium mustum TaxID=2773714 RepID=A0A9N8JTR5_9PEZI|nr:unnamed protein product [Aureobasidium mustum]